MAQETAVFGGGCFWCTEAVFTELKGVIGVMPGYAGGTTENPTYDEVSSGKTGHAEAVRIDFDPEHIAYRDLLTVFFASHDPTQINRQGNDVGTQYRSVIFYTSEAQKEAAEQGIKEINASHADGEAVVTQLEPLKQFYEAEDYHKDYYTKNASQPYCQLVINPKLDKVRAEFSALLKRAGTGATQTT
jgi:peptide-methionine (S)-S-oxide reductase